MPEPDVPEHIFTIFQGPDAGRRFTVGDGPVTLGRDPEREVHLHDDRASRLHAKIVQLSGVIFITDQSSSNGTFVNGLLVRERELHPGDVIVIGGNSIFFGPDEPSPERLAARMGPLKTAAQAIGETTQLLPESSKTPEVTQSRLGAIMEAVAESVRREAYVRGIHLSVEVEANPDSASVDPQQIFQALAGLLRRYMDAIPLASHPDSASRTECAMALRLVNCHRRGGFEIEIFGVGLPVARDRMVPPPDDLMLRESRRVIQAHGGALDSAPADAPATLAKIFLPDRSTGTMETMVRS